MALEWCQNFISTHSKSWEQTDGIWPQFAYALILARSTLGCYPSIFANLYKLWPLIDVIISFPLNILYFLRTNRWNLAKFCIFIYNGETLFGSITHQFSQINNRVIALDWCLIFVSAQYLENQLMEDDKILHMHCYWQELGWDCYASIFANLQQSFWPLIDVSISLLLNILRIIGWSLTKFYTCIDIRNI